MISNFIVERRFHLVREDSGNKDEFYKYYDSIDHMVPETTFNNMHGKLKDVRSVDGQMWQITLRKREDSPKPLQRSTKKSSNGEFKMNVSGWWSKDDVWGTSGWEVSSSVKVLVEVSKVVCVVVSGTLNATETGTLKESTLLSSSNESLVTS